MYRKKEEQTGLRNGDDRLDVERFEEKKSEDGKTHYLVKWEDLPASDNTWEPIDNLMGCLDTVVAFEENLETSQPARRTRSVESEVSGGPPAAKKVKISKKRGQRKQPAVDDDDSAAATDNDDDSEISGQNLDDSLPNEVNPGVTGTDTDGPGRARARDSDLYKVEKILNKKIQDGRTLYLVKWLEFSDRENSWEPRSSFEGCPELLEAFDWDEAQREKRKVSRQQKEQTEREKLRKNVQNASDTDPITKEPFPKPRRR